MIAGVLIDEKDEKKLLAMGVKDSKLLTPKQREALFEKIKKAVKKYRILIVEPQEIDEAVEDEEVNLNRLEAIKSAFIITDLEPDKAILDCPSSNIAEYTRFLKSKLADKSIEIRAEHKADYKYPVVGAASILAKVTRDREIEKIKKKIKQDIGSGYPSDPVTVAFLKKNYNKHPEIIRKSWETYKEIVRQKSQRKIGEF